MIILGQRVTLSQDAKQSFDAFVTGVFFIFIFFFGYSQSRGAFSLLQRQTEIVSASRYCVDGLECVANSPREVPASWPGLGQV